MNQTSVRAETGQEDTAHASAEALERAAYRLETAQDFDPLLERIGDARYVLLGEASHGTSEFYLSRARLSQRLIEEKGFSFIAVEGDWPDCYRVNRYVRGYPQAGTSAAEALREFSRWPTWMWANWEVVALAEWMRRRNAGQPEKKQAGFYGLDVYSLWESLDALLRYLERVDPDAAVVARKAYRCFEPYGEDVEGYARATALVPASCEAEVVALLSELRGNAPAYAADDREAFFDAEQNALVARDAEHYYRTMIRADDRSWNVRDQHMTQTLERLMQHLGPEAKAIVWEHNTHVGDARATDMAMEGLVNVGQLVREAHAAADVVLVGFGSYRGSVIAGKYWDAPMERMTVPPARAGSWEELIHRTRGQNGLYLLDGHEPALRATLGHRAIGVVYDPALDPRHNFVPTRLADRYDAFLYLDETRALHPLHFQPQEDGEPPETYPWNV